MLAGLGPAPGVLFVVAADEGWSRQSDEHLTAINALDLRHGLLAVTRSDLAPPDATLADSLDRIKRSSLGEVEAVACSGATGDGLDALRAALDRLVAAIPAADPNARVRLWIDRSFTVRGSGTVVTGTLSAGAVAVGDELDLDGRRVGVRAVQSLGTARDRVDAPARVALNLRGIGTAEVRRGDVLLTPGAWHRSAQADVRVDASELPEQLVLHLGTAAVPVRIRRLGGDIVRMTAERDLPLQAGDRAILRDPGRRAVAAGVLVLDADPPALRRRGAAAARAAELHRSDGRPDARLEVHRRGAVRRNHLERLGIPTDTLPDDDGWLIDDATRQRWIDRVRPAAEEWARQHPLQPAIPSGVLVRDLGLPDPVLLRFVLSAAGLPEVDGRVGVAEARSLGPAEVGVRALERRLADQPFAAPERGELAELGLGTRELAAAQKAGRLLRLDGDVIVLPSAPDHAVRALRALPQPFTTSAARQALGTTRRVAIPLLEHLDRTGRTVRIDATTRRVV
jgi:selenocysteine-specific elongation factor